MAELLVIGAFALFASSFAGAKVAQDSRAERTLARDGTQQFNVRAYPDPYQFFQNRGRPPPKSNIGLLDDHPLYYVE